MGVLARGRDAGGVAGGELREVEVRAEAKAEAEAEASGAVASSEGKALHPELPAPSLSTALQGTTLSGPLNALATQGLPLSEAEVVGTGMDPYHVFCASIIEDRVANVANSVRATLRTA